MARKVNYDKSYEKYLEYYKKDVKAGIATTFIDRVRYEQAYNEVALTQGTKNVARAVAYELRDVSNQSIKAARDIIKQLRQEVMEGETFGPAVTLSKYNLSARSIRNNSDAIWSLIHSTYEKEAIAEYLGSPKESQI